MSKVVNPTRVKVLSMTKHPIETLLAVWYQAKVGPNNLKALSSGEDSEIVSATRIRQVLLNPSNDDEHKLREELVSTFKMLMRVKSMSLKRHIAINWTLYKVPVALREQLVRHQNGNHFWVRTSRADDLSNAEYYMSTSLDDDQVEVMKESYAKINEIYKNILDHGMNMEDAKFVMPESRLHTLTWTSNLEALEHVLSVRTCWFAQEFWSPVIAMMMTELIAHLQDVEGYDEELVEAFINQMSAPPCSASCTRDCIGEVDMSEKMRGTIKQPVCPLFMKKYSSNPDDLEGYPQTVEPYKVRDNLRMFRSIWSKNYVDMIASFDENAISTDMPEDQIADIIKNAINNSK